MRARDVWVTLLAALGCEGAGLPPTEAPLGDLASVERAPSPMELYELCGSDHPGREILGPARTGDFAGLDARAEALRDRYRETPYCESHLWHAFLWLGSLNSSLLDAWVEARPESWAAHTARGSHWVDMAYRHRGNNNVASQDQWKAAHAAVARSQRDLDRAIELAPSVPVAYGARMRGMRLAGETQEIHTVLEAALAANPLTYMARRDAVESLAPSWGGSLESMKSVAEAAQAHATENPRLRVLLGFAHIERGRAAAATRDYAQARAHYERALAHGDRDGWYSALDWAIYGSTADYQRAIADRWIERIGDNVRARLLRGNASMSENRPRDALPDFERVVELSPRYWRGHSRRGLARELTGDIHGAIADYGTAVQLWPGAKEARSRRAQLVRVLESGGDRLEPLPGLAWLGL